MLTAGSYGRRDAKRRQGERTRVPLLNLLLQVPGIIFSALRFHPSKQLIHTQPPARSSLYTTAVQYCCIPVFSVYRTSHRNTASVPLSSSNTLRLRTGLPINLQRPKKRRL